MVAEIDVGPLERYVSLLEIIAAFPGELTATDLGIAARLPKSTAHRLVRILNKAGLVEGGLQRERTLTLGKRLTRLLHAAGQTDRAESMVLPTLTRFCEKVPDGSFYLAHLAGHRVFVVASAAADPRWATYVVPGQELPANAAASAKVILANQDSQIVEDALAVPMQKFTRATCTDPAIVREELKEAKQTGFAVCIDAINEGLSALAVPVVLPIDGVIYSVGLTGPITRRINEERDALLAILRDLSENIAPILTLRHRPVNG